MKRKSTSVIMRTVLVMMMACALSGFTSLEGLFAPKAELWPRWQKHQATATKTIDHRLWQAFLSLHIKTGDDGINRINYGGLTDLDKRALSRYLDQMRHTAISTYNRDEQLAYWINLYNALTVVLVQQHYPIKSIRDIEIGSGLFADGAWDHNIFTVENEKLTLNDIEHRILRPIWNDPRLHYAVNCASIGCPNLMPTAFTAANTEQLLNDGAVAYINHPRGAMSEANGLKLSKIYLWFAEDFGGNDKAITAHLRTYAFADLGAILDKNPRIIDYGYDWSLNK